ncbi:MAG TPA: cupin domain-containing protein [Microbacterium sp.]|uniref:cupin domain-containing protein n=1 Tax=Microbacterium sp. TaxID=51671 RepID=UPI000EEACB4E|nr:cupin domain-containing protein [Microbacterium sp.]
MKRISFPHGVVSASALRVGTGLTRKFVGVEHDADISYFFVENHPGEGPELHWHPYSETWIVLDGTVQITRGDETFTAIAGDTATVAPRVPHKFVNIGDGMLRIICIHASAIMIQTVIH